MRLDLAGKRARKLITDHQLTEEEIQQIVASARINLATFDPDYKTNVTQLAQELQKSRPTVYGWADRAMVATIDSLRNIRTGRPPKESRGRARSRRRTLANRPPLRSRRPPQEPVSSSFSLKEPLS